MKSAALYIFQTEIVSTSEYEPNLFHHQHIQAFYLKATHVPSLALSFPGPRWSFTQITIPLAQQQASAQMGSTEPAE